MLIVDSSGLIAMFSTADVHFAEMTRYFGRPRGSLVVSPYVVAEVDYLLSTRLSQHHAMTVLGELAGVPYILAQFRADDLRAAINVIDRYADQRIGVTDASLVVLAERYGTRDILTLDYRHFDVLRPLDGGRFRLMPRDWDGGDG